GMRIGVGWFLLIRHYVSRPWVAAAIATLLLADVGLLEGVPLARQVGLLSQTLPWQLNTFLEANPYIPLDWRPWRVITPAVSLASLLIFLWLLARARAKP